MKIIPSATDLRRWSMTFPTRGDLVFLDASTKKRIKNFPHPILSKDEVFDSHPALWNLNTRTWYCYALGKVDFCVWLPVGSLEKLDTATQTLLAKAQIRLGVPTLIKSSLIPTSLKSKLAIFDQHAWLSSGAWNKLSGPAKRLALKAWATQNEIETYTSIAYENLPDSALREARRLGLGRTLNRFSPHSGPNCMALATALASPSRQLKTANQWMLTDAFLNSLRKSQYQELATHRPIQKDVLVFSRNKQIVHAAYFLGDDLYVEKPGQDFFEPYRIDRFKNWKKSWPKTRLSIWRKEG